MFFTDKNASINVVIHCNPLHFLILIFKWFQSEHCPCFVSGMIGETTKHATLIHQDCLDNNNNNERKLLNLSQSITAYACISSLDITSLLCSVLFVLWRARFCFSGSVPSLFLFIMSSNFAFALLYTSVLSRFEEPEYCILHMYSSTFRSSSGHFCDTFLITLTRSATKMLNFDLSGFAEFRT